MMQYNVNCALYFCKIYSKKHTGSKTLISMMTLWISPDRSKSQRMDLYDKHLAFTRSLLLGKVELVVDDFVPKYMGGCD